MQASGISFHFLFHMAGFCPLTTSLVLKTVKNDNFVERPRGTSSRLRGAHFFFFSSVFLREKRPVRSPVDEALFSLFLFFLFLFFRRIYGVFQYREDGIYCVSCKASGNKKSLALRQIRSTRLSILFSFFLLFFTRADAQRECHFRDQKGCNGTISSTIHTPPLPAHTITL